MVKNKKNNKKNLLTFRLVSRSQNDPLINYEDAPKAVLVEDKVKRKQEQQKYGIYYDDDYDYLQHLKGIEEVDEEYYFEEFDYKNPKIKKVRFKDKINDKENDEIFLPSSLFPSQYQESVGMLNKAVLPSVLDMNWDPDIVEALDDKLNLDDENNVLDDDFVIKAMEGDVKECNNKQNGENDRYLKKNVTKFFDDTKTYISCGEESHFTNYSLTSSVIRKNKYLNNLDEHFENFFINELNEDEKINFLDTENEIDTKNDEKILNNVICKDFKNYDDLFSYQTDLPKESILKLFEKQLENEENHIEEMDKIEIKFGTGKNDVEDKWDCESILTTHSNIYNRPKLIFEKKSEKISVNKKTGIPENSLNHRLIQNKYNVDTKSIKSMTSLISQLSIRNQNETPEEKKSRKKVLKEYKKDRRLEKKLNKLAFKRENLRLNYESVTNKKLPVMNF